ncbi:MAG: ParB/RepB/Spo0J family partition protein [Thermodesulfobacteriota bacterium]|nr:ParB/RepB/Spo0J family partition protein [Thermodesulfobacteriota bacterium]
MSRNYEQDAEKRSVFLAPVEADGKKGKKGERLNTSYLTGAKLIDIERIAPDPNQPRQRFLEKTLQSLAESIKEAGGIIDPLTVEYSETDDHFRIISGERRYRAARMAGLERLPCMVEDVDDKRRLLLQLFANLQREDITPLEESEGIKSLIERFGYSQTRAAELLNKSPSYISQILGLERLGESARQMLQTSEVNKEVQIRASREKDEARQLEILKKASEQGKTVKEIRKEAGKAGSGRIRKPSESHRLPLWTWKPAHGRFVVTIRFTGEKKEAMRIETVQDALKEAYEHAKAQAVLSGGGEETRSHPNGI